MSDLFQDQGVIKTVLRPSTDPNRPKRGDEVAIVYNIVSGTDNATKNLVYTVGTSTSSLFVPVRTLDRIVCDMRRNEKCIVRISPDYSGKPEAVEVEVTLLHIRAGPSTQSGGLSSLNGQLGDLQSHLLRNPDVMEQMMSSPYMQSLMSNPESMRALIGMNPQMQELLQQNPELNSMMNDPEFLQQTMEAMRNPAMMREMMRNTDRAMSNIESLPGGSAALHKLYNEVQAPLFEASQASAGSVKRVTDSLQLKAKYGDLTKLDQPTSEPMANPWARAPQVTRPTVPQSRPQPDLSAMSQMMQDPSMQQMMGSMFRQDSSGSQQPFSNPAFLQQLFNPNAMQAMGRLEQSLTALQGPNATVPPSGFNGLFGNFLNAPSPQSRYRTQLTTLREMGFTDTQAAIAALDQCGGDVDQAAVLLASQQEEAESKK